MSLSIVRTQAWNDMGQYRADENLGIRKQKLLGIIIDRNLRFDEYVLNQCKKAGRKCFNKNL